MMTRRKWWISAVAACAAGAIGAGVALVAYQHRPQPDCATVRALVNDADRFTDSVAKRH
ncbi:hypothetical protein MBRA_50980 (plasmid) [Mycobacterium branderi]|uniref:Uncharacterized protein n=1 Tax=Mycobacterium branderi TaxID=43348 RepID=A0ABN6BD07_9MYCO|nr:hypothetical protein MBRA_50980 [Mycobacterium branderi]